MPLSNDMRLVRMQQHRDRITSFDGWSFYTPGDDVADGDGPSRDYGALFSSRDMILFDRIVQQFRTVEHEHDVSFTSLITLDSSRYHNAKVVWDIGQNS